jgi:hypothetical protein
MQEMAVRAGQGAHRVLRLAEPLTDAIVGLFVDGRTVPRELFVKFR